MRSYRFWRWLYWWCGRFGFYRLFIAVQAPLCLLVQPLLHPRNPAATLLGLRDRLASLSRGCGWSYFRLRFLKVDSDSSWRSTRLGIAGENFDCFGRTSTLRPVDGVEAEIVTLIWVGARIHEQPDDIRVTADNCKNEGGLAAARPLVYIRAIGQ